MQLKSTLVSILIISIIAGCAGTKAVVYSPVGTWDYTVYNTPNGDSSGKLILTESEDGMTGMLSSPDLGETDLNDLKYRGEEKSLNASFWLDMAGMDLLIQGTFEGDNFTGSINAGEMGVFEMKATRQIAK